MRDLKFRAWSKSKKEFIAEGFTLLGEMLSTGALLCTCFENGVDIDDLEITQWTGQVDIKGMAIYEGDIVKWEKVCYNFDIGLPDGKEQFIKTITSFIEYRGHSFWIKEESFGWEGEGLWDWSEIEVIGNIYQTTEDNE